MSCAATKADAEIARLAREWVAQRDADVVGSDTIRARGTLLAFIEATPETDEARKQTVAEALITRDRALGEARRLELRVAALVAEVSELRTKIGGLASLRPGS